MIRFLLKPLFTLLGLTTLIITVSACASFSLPKVSVPKVSIPKIGVPKVGVPKIGIPAVFRPDLDQGNLIDQEKLAEVEIGMEPRQVRRLLGTPLLTDTFTKNRWDYYYSLRQGKTTEVHHHITVFFEDGRVSEVRDQLNP